MLIAEDNASLSFFLWNGNSNDLFGQPADYPRLSEICRRHGLKLIADSAQGFGCTLAGEHPVRWADAATTSFFPAKPLGGYGDPWIVYLILPAATQGVPGGFWYARILKASLVGTLHQDYVRTARSKGLAQRLVVIRHALPNAIIPVLTIAAMDLGQLFGGIVVVEAVFSWPGIGLMAYQALQALDVPLVIGTVLFTALCIALLNILADVLRVLVDPRVRLA